MFSEPLDKSIPLIDKRNLQEQLSSKSSLFISDCETIHSNLNHANFPSYDFDTKEIELESSFASLTVQLFTIEEIITLLFSNDSSSSFHDYAHETMQGVSLKINELNHSYRREYQLFSLIRSKEGELTKKLYGNGNDDIEENSSRTNETSYKTDSRSENKQRNKECGNVRINDFIKQMLYTIERINKAIGGKEKDKDSKSRCVINVGIIGIHNDKEINEENNNIAYERRKTLMVMIFSVLFVMFVVYSYIY